MVNNEYLGAGFGFDTAENELSEVWGALLLPACLPESEKKKQPWALGVEATPRLCGVVARWSAAHEFA